MREFTSIVHATPAYIETLRTSTPIADHVSVDFELRGCPINQQQLIEVISAFLHGRKPNTPPHSVCLDCKMRGPCAGDEREGKFVVQLRELVCERLNRLGGSIPDDSI